MHHPKRTVTTTTAVTTTAATTTYTPTTTYTQASTTTTTVAPTPTQQTTTHTHTQHTNTCTSSHGCGYCLSVSARIGTPDGSVPVADVRPGMLVWSANLRGQRISEKVLKIRRAHVPADHPMVRLRLADGRELLVSLSHPLPSGQPVEMLAAGQRFEGTRVVSAARVRYGRPYTYDLLPAGPTHTYFADGVLMGSTLAPAGAVISRPF